MIVRLLVLAGVIIVLIAALGAYSWQSYSVKFSQVDHAFDRFTVNPLPSVVTPNGTGATLSFRSESIYKNSKSGVALRLPGNWKLLPGKGINNPDQSHRFCVLGSDSGLSAMFWPRFPEYLPSLSSDADFIRQRSTSNGFNFEKETEILIGSRKAVLLEFLSPDKQTSLNMLLLRRWPVVYILAVSGPGDGRAWEEVKNGLSQSIELQ